jgi:hypothetical protein
MGAVVRVIVFNGKATNTQAATGPDFKAILEAVSRLYMILDAPFRREISV